VSLLKEFQVVLPNLIVVDARLIVSWELKLKLWTTQVDFINYTSKRTDAKEFIQQAKFNFPNYYNKKCPRMPSNFTGF
jgi:hypothetical protein